MKKKEDLYENYEICELSELREKLLKIPSNLKVLML